MPTIEYHQVHDSGQQSPFGVCRPDRKECEAVYKYAFDIVGKKMGKYEHTISRWKNGVENPSERLKGAIAQAAKAGVSMEKLLVLAADLEEFIRRQYVKAVEAQDVIRASLVEQQTQHVEDDAQFAFVENPTVENAHTLAFAHKVNAGADLGVAVMATAYASKAR